MTRETKQDRRPSCPVLWRLAIVAAALFVVSSAHATNYSEATSGDLSNDPSCPTGSTNSCGSQPYAIVPFTLTPGDNYIVGSTIPSGQVVDMTGARAVQDPDYVTFTVPYGYMLSQLDIESDSAILPGDRMFLGIARGIGVYLNGPEPASGLLGWTLVDSTMAASDHDLLPDLGSSAPANFPDDMFPGATRFSGPLGAGDYTLWILDGDNPVNPYDLDLIVVPEPAVWMLMATGFGLLIAMRGRRSSRRGTVGPLGSSLLSA